MDMEQIRTHTGSWYQVAGTRHYMLTDGFMRGTRAIDVRTGSGLEYTVLPDRGLDISLASFNGVNLVYLGTQGEASPAFYDNRESEWLRSFYAGLLTTCGPNNIGPPCVDDGETLGLHGRFNNTPANNCADLTDIENGVISIKGTVDCSVMFGHRLKAERSITSRVGENRLTIEDVITNDGNFPAPITMLYHVNAGYPLLDRNAQIDINSVAVQGLDEYSTAAIDGIYGFLPPDANNREKNYLHSFDGVKRIRAQVYNPKLGFGLYIEADTADTPLLNQWKLERVRDYILGLEPCTVPCISRAQLRERGMLPYLIPGEQKRITVEIGIANDCVSA